MLRNFCSVQRGMIHFCSALPGLVDVALDSPAQIKEIGVLSNDFDRIVVVRSNAARGALAWPD